jgi:GntR family transcriptional regulator, transcriptional repressor for pyruvate dehydrogenase complex
MMIGPMALLRPSPTPGTGAPPHLVAQRLSDRLADRLIAQIQSGALKPGDRLPTELQLASAHGVSRTVVREAVHQLKSRQLLVSRQGSGSYVAQPPATLALDFDAGVLGSIEAVVQVREVRRALEGEIASLAAERATRAQVAAMRAALQKLDRAVAAGGDGVDEDLAFHRSMAEATGNPQFTRLLAFLEQYLHDAMRVTRANEARRPDYMDAVRDEHHAIVEAIASGDPAAARRKALRHMLQGERRLKDAGLLSPRHATADTRTRR